MTLAANALQAGIYTRLTAQLGASVPVYDFVPQESAFPYVVIGRIAATSSNTKTNDGQQFELTLHAFTKGAGKKTVNTIMQNIHSALHHQESNITVSGFQLVMVRMEFMESFQDATFEGDTDHYYQGVQRYRVIVRNT